MEKEDKFILSDLFAAAIFIGIVVVIGIPFLLGKIPFAILLVILAITSFILLAI